MLSFISKLFKRENTLAVLLVIGAFAGLVGVPQQIGITSDQIVMGLLGLLVVDTLIERLGYLDRIESHIHELESKLKKQVSADDVLHPRSDLPPFSLYLENSEEVWLAGKNLAGLFTSYGSQIEKAARSGKHFRILLMNVKNQSLIQAISFGSFTQADPSSVERRSQDALSILVRLQKNVPPNSIEIKLIDYIFTNTFLILDGKKPNGQMVIEMYSYKISTAERLHLTLKRTEAGRTYTHYLERFESMWNDAESFQAS